MIFSNLQRKLGTSVCNCLLRMVHVQPIPALDDNYMYLITDKNSKVAAIVDPVEPQKVNATLKENDVELQYALTTHHHWDHAGGNEELKRMFPNIKFYGGDDRIGALTNKVTHGDTFKIGGLSVKCLFTPCHTSGHICYYVNDDSKNGAVFTGDTLFIGGCGKFFEGTGSQMYEALVKILGALPDATKVYCGHEYTVSNLKYAHHAEPDNKDVLAKMEWAKSQKCTVPSTIGEEKSYNPFMRVESSTLMQRAGSNDPAKVMQFLRDEKNSFKG